MVRAVLELAEPAGVGYALPAEMAGTLRMEAAASVAEMTAAIRSEVTEYSLPLDDAYASTLGRAVRHAVGTFIDRVEDPGTPMTAIVAEFREIGFAAAREGHSLEPLCGGRVPRWGWPPGASSTATGIWCDATSTCPRC